MPERRLISFTVDGYRFAVPLEAVREVLNADAVVSVPGARGPLEGIIQYRGNRVLPVFSLLEMLGRQHTREGHLVVVTGDEDDPVGFRVEAMGGVMMSGDSDEVGPYQGDLSPGGGVISGELKKAGGELILLDLDRLLDF